MSDIMVLGREIPIYGAIGITGVCLALAYALLYKENPVLDTGFVEAMRLNNNFPTVKLKLRSGNCNKV